MECLDQELMKLWKAWEMPHARTYILNKYVHKNQTFYIRNQSELPEWERKKLCTKSCNLIVTEMWHLASGESFTSFMYKFKISKHSTGTPPFMRQLCSKEKSQRVKSHKSKTKIPSPPTFLLCHLYNTLLPLPPSHLIGQKAIRTKASVINLNRSKLGEGIKIKSHFSNTHTMRNTCISEIIPEVCEALIYALKTFVTISECNIIKVLL
jgi:hypothetical protein